MKTTIITLMILLSFSNEAFLGKLMEYTAGGPKDLPNCDSEAAKEKKYDKDYPTSYWVGQLDKAVKRKDFCRQAQLWWHFWLVEPAIYRDNNGWKKTIEALYQGNFFLELQWQIKNYRKERGNDELIDYYQVSSYWPHIEAQYARDLKRNGCYTTLGYYEHPISGERYTLLEEAFMSANDFLSKYPDSIYSDKVEQKRKVLKDINAAKQLCTAKSSLQHMESKKGGAGPENYWSMYTRLAQIIANYQESSSIEESLYLMAAIVKKIDVLTHGKNRSPVGDTFDFLYNENWSAKFEQLKDILETEYPSSPWTAKIRKDFP